MSPSMIWAALLPLCGIAAWLILRKPIRGLLEDRDAVRARESFRREREWLEARFLQEIAHADRVESVRWEDAEWHNDVAWARDRRTRRLIALVGVDFAANPFAADSEDAHRHATAFFEFRAGHWHADGRHLNALQPNEAFLRHRQLEPIILPSRKG
jgi:hypothetical protein